VADFRIRGLPRAALRRVKARLTKPKRVRAECVDLTSRTADPIEAIAELASPRGITGDTWWVPDQGGYVEVQILAAGDSWAALVSDGKHRTTALGAVGAKDLLVSIPSRYPVVRREDVASWPAVCSGLYTVEQALEVFDRFLAGAPPNGFPELGRTGLS